MCGIFGYVGKTPADITKIKTLGIYNVTRGTDSCGIVINNKVYHGMKDQANWTDFCEKNKIGVSTKDSNYTIIAHTRSASVKSTKDDIQCAHPLTVKSKKNQVKLIGVHNGTLTNSTKLAKEFSVKEGKIDSITLMNILADSNKNDKLFKVFEEYEGAATVMWFHPNEPNTLKIFKGGSKDSHNTTAEYVEERPLYCYKVDEETFYFSSIKESLYFIGGDINSVSTIPLNCVITVKPGEKFRIKPINRTKVDITLNNNIWESRYATTGGSSCSTSNNFRNGSNTKTVSRQVALASKLKTCFKGYLFSRVNQFPIVGSGDRILIDNEPFVLDQANFGAKVTFWKGRYTRNGHLIGTDKDKYVELELDIYGFEKNAKGKENPNCDIESTDKYYFFQGLLLLSKEHGDALLEKEKARPFIFNAAGDLNISEIAKYFFGFTCNFKDITGTARNEKGNWCNGTITPMFDYSRKYNFTSGNFNYGEIVNITISDITNTIKLFETKKEEKPKEISNLPILTAIGPNYSSMFDEANDDKLYNLVQDAQSSLKAVQDELESTDVDKYIPLKNKINSFRRILVKSYEDAKNGKIITPFTVSTEANEGGLLYS